MTHRTASWILAAGCLCACGIDTGVERAEVALEVTGTDVDELFEGRGGARIDLDQATLAFGPLYLCRGAQAGELCEVAALEWTDTRVVDALDPEPRRTGTLTGATGVVRSFMYDLGLHSTLTRERPLVLDAARELDGHSVRLRGVVELAGRRLPFLAEVAVEPGEDAERGVPMVQSNASDRFEHVVEAEGERLRVRFDPRPWLERVDFAQYLDTRRCDDPEAPVTVCTGDVAQRCAADGSVASERDCAAQDDICLPELGCRARIEVEPDSQAWRAIRTALLAGEHPAFEWE